jgi:hypothetical protein
VFEACASCLSIADIDEGYVDAFRAKHGAAKGAFTYWSMRTAYEDDYGGDNDGDDNIILVTAIAMSLRIFALVSAVFISFNSVDHFAISSPFSARAVNKGLRLDYFIASKSLLPRLVRALLDDVHVGVLVVFASRAYAYSV